MLEMAAFTTATALSNLSLSSPFRSSSMIFSTPPFPTTAGTPIVTSEWPYSPSRYVGDRNYLLSVL